MDDALIELIMTTCYENAERFDEIDVQLLATDV
jgi:hypothetical protein